MKTTIKISILVVVACLAISAVLVFLRYQMSPPKASNFHNQFLGQINKDLAKLEASSISMQESSAIFDELMEKIEVYKENELLNTVEHSTAMNLFLDKFVPCYASVCDNYFRSSAWTDADIAQVESRYKVLKIDQNAYHGDASNAEHLNKISQIINVYHEAKRVAGSGFVSMQETRNIKGSVARLRSNEYISRNAKLMNQLNGVVARHGAQHFARLENQVNHLSSYRSFSGIGEYNQHKNAAMVALNEYDNNAVGVYGRRNDTTPLRNRLASTTREAVNWFNYSYYGE